MLSQFLLNTPLFFLFGESLDDIALFQVVEPFDTQATIGSRLDLFHLVFVMLQAGELTLVDKNIITIKPHQSVGANHALFHHTTGDSAHTFDFENFLQPRHSTSNLFKRINQENLHKINLLIKADSDGSIEALKDSFQKLSTDEVEVKIIHAAVGGVLETDVSLASASDAIIVGFHVRTSNEAKLLADNEKVQIRLYTVIYDAIDDLKDAMSGLLSPEVIEVAGGMTRLKKVFKIKGVGTIAGCVVEKGVVRSDALVRLYRDDILIYEGQLSSLKHYKDEVKEVKAGTDCGLSIEGFNDLKEGDVIETFTKEEKERRIQ